MPILLSSHLSSATKPDYEGRVEEGITWQELREGGCPGSGELLIAFRIHDGPAPATTTKVVFVLGAG